MIEQMDCQKYREHLDEWIDGALSADMAAAMEAHMQVCPACAEDARIAREALDLIHSLEDDIPVPLAAQSAWRTAVRAEAKQRRRNRFSTAFRAVASVAAAFVLLAGCTVFFRSNGMLIPSEPATATTAYSTGTSADEAAEPMPVSGPGMMKKSDSPTLPMVYIASDGAADETATAEIADADEVITIDAAQQNMLIRSVERTIVTNNYDGASQNIRDLTEQYGGYLADDATTTAADGLRVGEFTAVVPALEADSFLQTVDHIGNVTYTADHYEDASLSVQDVQSRINALQAEQDRLSELIPTAADADELSRLSTLMQATLSEIDVLQSEANLLESKMENVRVSITLEELYAASTASPTAEPKLTQRMSSAFSQSAANLQSFVHDMAVSLMIIAPFLLVALGVVAVVTAIVLSIRHIRRKDS